MVGNTFTLIFLATASLTLLLFGLAEVFRAHRNLLAALAAIAEAGVFALISWLFYQINWGSLIPSEVMAFLPVGGVIFALNMAHKRLTGRIL
ncbi:MAG: hypothetical protein DI585_05415 [Pseudomonas fluorescens]|nr:MAG: hypothetical protein DI585_05415 [Pseudomonas fluorescens]